MKHAHIVPLVGGAAIGASLALKSNPEYIASWEAFAKNDAYARNYFSDTPFYLLDKGLPKVPQVDIITCVPPCAGLSTATPVGSRGCQAPQNEHMLKVAEYGMQMKTKVILIENAPALYGRSGQEFAERFRPLLEEYRYSMVLYKTSTILHGLPQNRVRSFAILYKGDKVPMAFSPIRVPYKPLDEWKPSILKSSLATKWSPKNDELIQVLLKHFGFKDNAKLILRIAGMYYGRPVTAWKVFRDLKIKHKFTTKPYKYMQEQSKARKGIMDRSPYLVSKYTNALIWKSAHKMMNPVAPDRNFSIRELMNMMGLPKDFPEIPAKDINVLFQNVPVNTVRTIVEMLSQQLQNKHLWNTVDDRITRYNNIKDEYEKF